MSTSFRHGVVAAMLVALPLAGCGSGAVRDTVVAISIPAPSLAGSLIANEPEQSAMVWLPPGYDDRRRFPVVYYLPGFTTDVGEYFDGSLWGWRVDRALAHGVASGDIDEVILVVVNGRNALGGSFYLDSPVTGNWESFVAEDVVSTIDARFNTVASREGRALAGDSMGGFGALNLAMRHPDVFRAVYALSPGLFADGGLESSGLLSRHRAAALRLVADRVASEPRDRRARVLGDFVRALELSGDRFNYFNGFVIAYAGALAPSGRGWLSNFGVLSGATGVPGFDAATEARLEAGFGDWRSKVRLHRGALLALDALVLDCGRNDRLTWIPEGCAALSAELRSAGVAHELRLHDGGHIDRLGERLEGFALPMLARILARSGRPRE